MNNFKTWFIAQFGGLPMDTEKRRKIDYEFNQHRICAEKLKNLIEADSALLQEWRAATYARQAWERGRP